MGSVRLLRATFTIDTVTLCCRHCRELIDEPKSGSTVWTVADVRARIETDGNEIDCRCGGRVWISLPVSLKTKDS